MKKSLMIFVALVGITAISAQKKKAAKAPAVKAPAVTAPTVTAPTVTAPVVTAPKVDMGSAGDMNKSAGAGLGLRIGLGLGYATNVLNKSGTLQNWGAANRGFTVSNADKVGTAAGNATSWSSNENGANSLSAIDATLRVEYDVLSWLFVRAGFNYAQVLSNEYTFSAPGLNNGVNTGDNSVTFKSAARQMEIPLMVGFNLVQVNKSALYFAVGAAFVSGGLDNTLSATGFKTAGTGGQAATFKDVEGKISATTIGIIYALGGRVEVANNVSIFGEVRYLSGAKVGLEIDKTVNDGTSIYANTNVLADSLLTNIAGSGAYKMDTYTNTQKKKDLDGIDFSYTRWNVGVNYAL